MDKKQINWKNKDDKMFSICICKTVALNYREIEMNPERVSNIKPLINEYKWNGINYPSKIDEKIHSCTLKLPKKLIY